MDNPLLLNGPMARLRAPGHAMPTDTLPAPVIFEGRIEDVLGAEHEDRCEASAAALPSGGGLHVDLSLHDDLASIEQDWRAFEERADCTVFQTFDWLSTWLRNIGQREGAKPAIVIGRHQGAILFVMPFALDTNGRARRITWLGSGLCNYNGPLLARDFARRVSSIQFMQVWGDVQKLLRDRLDHDMIDLEKMPDVIGEQANPFCALRVTPHVNNAYLTTLVGDWETYYAAKRSSSTRRSDRKKQRRLAEFGELRFITAGHRDDIVRTLDALIEEKTSAYAKLGVDNMFELPGYRDFFLDLATGSSLAHLSRVDVGDDVAAANFGLVFRGTYIYFLAGYNDGEVGRFGPGAFQLMEMLRYSIERGLKVFDFTIGDEPYKHDWCDAEMRLYEFVSPATLRGWLVVTPAMAMRSLKRHVRQTPAIWAIVRKARMWAGSLRR
jgi:CelD/BcsL family acetyltransferase involved in cellulose biosynthesis